MEDGPALCPQLSWLALRQLRTDTSHADWLRRRPVLRRAPRLQGSGRAGRDGLPSLSLLYASAADLRQSAKMEKGTRRVRAHVHERVL